jgi:hypothetical protein
VFSGDFGECVYEFGALRCLQDPSPSFKVMNFYSNGIPVFDLLGDGTGIWHKGGIKVEDGGITIARGGVCTPLLPRVFQVSLFTSATRVHNRANNH